jgi:GT2 family glycosyltransferase
MKPPSPSLAITLVAHAPDFALLEEVLAALDAAIAHARAAGELSTARLTLVDHGPGEASRARLTELAAAHGARLLSPSENRGFGAGHNLALRDAEEEYFLILNPDAVLDPAALTAGLRALAADPAVALVAPRVDTGPGGPQHLCKRAPDPWTLCLRGFAPAWLRRRFRARLDRYAMADLDPERAQDVPLASGCCMLVRGAAFRAAGGFDERYFLYFEDFDLCLALRAAGGRIRYVPGMRVRHHRGGAAAKGALHRRLFLASAWKYFRKHGFASQE